MPYKEANQLGMYKQQLYDQNLQKIYSGIEQTAALPLSADVDKQYLQESLNNLQTSLKKLNTADFSQNQVFNSVAGMTSKISKDKYIQAGVMSTMRHQSEMEKRKQLEKEGKTDKNNDDWYNANWSNYANRKELARPDGSPISFSEEYVPYTDIFKLGNDLLKQAGENHLTVEELFITERDASGKVVPKMFYDASGKPTGYRYADVKTIEKLTTNKDAVIGALNTLMSRGDVNQQLQIDGWANYRGIPAEALAAPMKKGFEQNARMIEGRQLEITALLSAQNLTPERKAELTELSKQLEAAAKRNDSEFKDLQNQLSNNPEGFKQNLYRNQFKNNFLNIFNKEKKETLTDKSEGKEQENWRETMNFNRLKEANDVNYKNAQLAISREELKLKQIRTFAEIGQDEYGNWFVKPSPNSTGTGTRGGQKIKPNDPSNLNEMVPGDNSGDEISPIATIEKDISTLDLERVNVATSIYKRMLQMQDPNVTDATVMAAMDKFRKATGETREQFVVRQAYKLNENFVNNGLKPDQGMFDALTQLKTVNKKFTDKVNQYEAIKKQAAQESGVGEDFVEKVKPISVNISSLEKRDDDWRYKNYEKEIKLDGRDMFDIYNYINRGAGIVSSKNEDALANQGKQRIEAKFGIPINRLVSGLSTSTNVPGTNKTAHSFITETFANKKTETYIKTLSKKLQPLVGVQDRQTIPLTPTTADRDEVSAEMSNYLISNRTPGTIGEKFDSEEFIKYMNDSKSKINLVAIKPVNEYEDWSGEVVVTNEDGKNMSVKVDKDFMQRISKNQFLPFNVTAQPMKNAILAYGKGSTNSKTLVTDPNAWKSAYLTPELGNPDLIKKGVEYYADAVEGPNGWYLANYVKFPDMKEFKTFYSTPFPTERDAKMAFQNTPLPLLQSFIKPENAK